MSKKILFLIRSLHYGGAERQLVTLAKGLHERGHIVKVAVFYDGGELEDELCKAGISIIRLNKRSRWDVCSFLLRLCTVLRQERPDVLHSYLTASNLLIVFLKPFFGQVRLVWGVRAANMDLDRYDWFARMTYRVECKLSCLADLIICNSHAGMEYAVYQGFPRAKMVVVPNGIDTDRFYPNLEVRSKIRAEWGVQEAEKLIGLVARLDPMKDHETFLRAAALLAEERTDVRFVCVGNGPERYKGKLISLSRELGLDGKIIWAGAREDIASVYNSLDIAVSSSYGEGFPNVIAEAMACGVTCVVTNVGDSAQIVNNLGVVVPPKDSDVLATGLSQALNQVNPDKSFLHNSVKDRFSCGVLIKRTEEVIFATSGHKL